MKGTQTTVGTGRSELWVEKEKEEEEKKNKKRNIPEIRAVLLNAWE